VEDKNVFAEFMGGTFMHLVSLIFVPIAGWTLVTMIGQVSEMAGLRSDVRNLVDEHRSYVQTMSGKVEDMGRLEMELGKEISEIHGVLVARGIAPAPLGVQH